MHAEFRNYYTFCQPVIHDNILISGFAYLIVFLAKTCLIHNVLRLITSYQFRFFQFFFADSHETIAPRRMPTPKIPSQEEC